MVVPSILLGQNNRQKQYMAGFAKAVAAILTAIAG